MKEFPEEVQARLAGVLAEIELELAETESGSTEHLFTFDQGYFWLDDPAYAVRVHVALTAAAVVVEIVSALEWPAADRQRAVVDWHDQIVLQCAIDHQRFVTERRKQPWWRTFQERLRHAGRTRVPAKAAATFGQELKQVMIEARISVDGLVAATNEAKTPITKRTIERLRADERPPQIGTVRVLEAVLTKALGMPFRFQRLAMSRPRRRQPHSRKRSQ